MKRTETVQQEEVKVGDVFILKETLKALDPHNPQIGRTRIPAGAQIRVFLVMDEHPGKRAIEKVEETEEPEEHDKLVWLSEHHGKYLHEPIRLSDLLKVQKLYRGNQPLSA